MKTQFCINETFLVPSRVIYEAWLSSALHSKMTGGKAVISTGIETDFTAWDGYISGTTIELVENEKIVQSWRTLEFDKSQDSSRIEITLKDLDLGCEITLTHSNIPEGQPDYKLGWVEHYFQPMKHFFSSGT